MLYPFGTKENSMNYQVEKERTRYREYLEENPPLREDDGWLCPECDKCHRTIEDAEECCMPDYQDYDQARYERTKND